MIKSCSYGKNSKYINVTSIVKTHLVQHGYVEVNNVNFTDPIPGVRKELVINFDQSDNSTPVIVEEDGTYRNPSYVSSLYTNLALDPHNESVVSNTITNNELVNNKTGSDGQVDKPIKLKCYYHIFCNDNPVVFQIVDEQLETFKSSNLYSKFDVINCCVTGNNLTIYNLMINKLTVISKDTNNKIKIHKCIFGDKTYERYTLYSIKDDPDLDNNNTFILYIHSKGISRRDAPAMVAKWRKCLLHFLVTKGQTCIDMFMKHPYDTVGIFHVPYGNMSPDGAYYAGNFWWARGPYLKQLFNNYTIGSTYCATEQFLFKNQPIFRNLYDWNWNLQAIEPHNYLHRK